MADLRKLRFLPRSYPFVHLCTISLLAAMPALLAVAQPNPPRQSSGATLEVDVVDAGHKPIVEASVFLQKQGSSAAMSGSTDHQGVFLFSALPGGAYTVSAEKLGLRSRTRAALTLSDQEQKHLELVLDAQGAAGSAQPDASASVEPSTGAMEFADQPNFTVAGVTDWTAVGGHGSDITLRTSEALATDTAALKPDSLNRGVAGHTGLPTESENTLRALLAATPESFEANHKLGEFYLGKGQYREAIPLLQTAYQIDPANYANEFDLAVAYRQSGDFSQAREHVRKMLSHQNSADLHRFSGSLEEQIGDPLAAVHEYEQAVRLDPSEQNYFDWGSELLLHRAVWQAQSVFEKGAQLYPKSLRMLTALGTALFAGGLYEQAALRVCEASDLDSSNPEPYLFLGKIERASPMPLTCVEPKLAQFVQQQPQNALAHYYDAMALLKRQAPGGDPQTMQQVEKLLIQAVSLDPKCGDAYLQLGILSASRHNLPASIAFYQKAIAADPQLGEAHYRLGVSYDRSGDATKAKQEFELHDEIEKQQAADVERQRREVKQFVVELHGRSKDPATQ